MLQLNLFQGPEIAGFTIGTWFEGTNRQGRPVSGYIRKVGVCTLVLVPSPPESPDFDNYTDFSRAILPDRLEEVLKHSKNRNAHEPYRS